MTYGLAALPSGALLSLSLNTLVRQSFRVTILLPLPCSFQPMDQIKYATRIALLLVVPVFPPCSFHPTDQALRFCARGGGARRAAGVRGHQAAPAQRDLHDDHVLAALYWPDSSPSGEVRERRCRKRGSSGVGRQQGLGVVELVTFLVLIQLVEMRWVGMVGLVIFDLRQRADAKRVKRAHTMEFGCWFV